MIPDQISIAITGNTLILILFIIIVIGLSILFYRYTLPPLPPTRRLALSILRSLSVSLLVLIVFEPVLRFINREEKKPTVAILIDDSQSMSIKDNGRNRAETVKEFLEKDIIAQKLSQARVIYYKFSSNIFSLSENSSDSISFSGETTDLSTVFGELKDQLQKENIQAVILLTDGNYNTGKNPIYNAEVTAIPFYSIGIGDTSEQKDVLVQKVVTNNLAYAETRFPVDIIIKSVGYENENLEVQLSEGSTIIDQTKITLRERIQEYPVQLHIEPHEEGVRKYTINVSELPGELTDKNNLRSFFIKVLRSKLQILLFAGAPSPDVSAIRQVLIEDKHLTIKTFIEKRANEFYGGNYTRSETDSADCFVFLGFPSLTTSGSTITQLREVIDQNKKPILFINGKTTDYTKLQYFESILPFGWSNVSATEVFVFPFINERQKLHPLITLEGTMSADDWQQLPPIYKMQTMFKAKAEAEVLASVKIQNISLGEPLIAFRNISRQKSFAITGHGMWRWRLLTQGSSRAERILSLLITNAIRWLTIKEDEKNVRVTPVKDVFTTTEAAAFTAQVYDEQLKPIDNAEVVVELQRGKDKFQMTLNAIGNGRYEGSMDGLSEGDYTFTANASSDGKIYGEDKGRFSIGQINIEFLETKMNKPFLEQLAYRTGGKYYNVGEAVDVARDLEKEVNFASKEVVRSQDIELWNWKYLGGVIVLLLGIEWFLRKRSGML